LIGPDGSRRSIRVAPGLKDRPVITLNDSRSQFGIVVIGEMFGEVEADALLEFMDALSRMPPEQMRYEE